MTNMDSVYKWRNVENFSWSHCLTSLALYFWCFSAHQDLTCHLGWAGVLRPDRRTSGRLTDRKESVLFLVLCECTGRRKKAEFVRKQHCALAWEGRSAFPPACPHNNHSGEVAAKAAALIEETMTSCDAAAYTWHSSITELSHLTLCSERDTWVLIYSSVAELGHSLHPLSDTFYLSTVLPSWNSEQHCLALRDPCPRTAVNRKPHGIPPCFVNVMSENRKLRDMTFTALQATVWICCCGTRVLAAQDVMRIFVNWWSVTSLITH